tara:strand:+ start:308 stop:550 length:243 start_codon:yes stop_codon:yes gene_type:complete
MTKEETYKKALEKISRYGIKPDGETEWQRIKRLKSIADKALFIADVVVPKGTFNCGKERVYNEKRCSKQCNTCIEEYKDN